MFSIGVVLQGLVLILPQANYNHLLFLLPLVTDCILSYLELLHLQNVLPSRIIIFTKVKL